MKRVIFSFFIIFFYSNLFSQIIEFNFNNDPYLTVSNKDNNLEINQLSINTGTIGVNKTTTAFTEVPYIESTGGWNETTQATAKNFYFDINTSANATFTITRITFEAYATDAGPSAYGISIDNTPVFQANMPVAIVTADQVINGYENIKTARIKIQAWNNSSRATSGGGSFRIDNIKVYGTVQSVDIVADRLRIDAIPNFVLQNQTWAAKIAAVDAQGNIDTDFNENLSFAKNTGVGNLSSENGDSKQFINGIAEFSALKYDGNDNFNIQFSTTNLAQNSLISNIIQIAEPLENENFSDNDLTKKPNWMGDIQYFGINPNLQLQSNGPDNQASKLGLSAFNLRANETEWRFTLDLGFNPTSSNFLRIYLISNQLDLKKELNGYFIQIGQTGSDYIKLMRQNGSQITEIASGTSAYNSNINTKIKVTREANGLWKIFSAKVDEENYSFEANAEDNTFTKSNYFGFYCDYSTTSRYNLYRFDDIYVGEIIPDIEKPYIQELKAITKNKIRIKFSEFLKESTIFDINNYKLNDNIYPQTINYYSDNKQIIELSFAENFQIDARNTIQISQLSDLAENIIDLTSYEFTYIPLKFNEIGVNSSTKVTLYFSEEISSSYVSSKQNFMLSTGSNPANSELLSDKKSIELTFNTPFENNQNYKLSLQDVSSVEGDIVEIQDINFIYHKPEVFDLVINEIMPDPEPRVQLPAKEYIEIYNRSNYTITLKNWELIANTSVKKLNHCNINSGEFLILCKDEDYSDFESFGKVLPVLGFPSLSNSEMSIKLKNIDNKTITSVNYSSSWIQAEIKRDGGWSLERIDPNNLCQEADNWKESIDRQGGTPGKRNSVYAINPDISKPEFTHLELIDSTKLKLSFNEIIDFQNIPQLSNFNVDNDIKQPEELILSEELPYSIILKFQQPFAKKTIYTLTINSNISDCAGNKLPQTYNARFAIPEKANPSDVIINEVLFNPYPEGSDFIELYNRSEKVIDLKTLSLTNRDENGNLKTKILITESNLLFPNNYFVITSDKENTIKTYNTENEFNVLQNTLPSMPDNEGNIVILNENIDIIDDFSYNENMHFALLSNKEGISLERIDTEVNTNNKQNWHSASEFVGFATPTYRNSAYKETPTSDETIAISPEVFSPDNDGYDDLVYISYNLDKSGYTANVLIYDTNGKLVYRIANNELLNQEGFFTWDGTYNENQVANMGIYIIFIELFDMEGTVKSYKKTCVLAKQF